MQLIVLGSNSTGNGYILTNERDTLLIEAGIRFMEVKKALDFKVSTISGAVISHSHNDHSKYVQDFVNNGINTLMNKHCHEAKRITGNNAKIVEPLKGYKLGNFKVIPFDLNHDVPCNGYIIDHPDMGRLIFITDTYLCKYTFPDVKHWLIEANYSDEILDGRNCAYKNRVYTSHLSIDNTKGILKANDLSKTNTIILCHLSDGNSNEKKFISDIQRETGIITIAADRNVQIELTNV